MNKILIVLIIILIIANIVLFIYGRTKINAIKKIVEANDQDYKKGMKYIVISSLVSFLTVILITIVAILKLISK